MQRNLNSLDRRSRWLWWSALTIATLAMTACGPLGDDSDPTATAETITQPTSPAMNGTAPAPTSGELQPNEGIATPETGLSTPVFIEPDNPRATPTEPDTVIVGTPIIVQSGIVREATPDAAASDSVFVGSDGTSGATPDPGIGIDTEAGTPQGTDTLPEDPAVVSDAATPAAGATPEAIALTDLQPVTVAGCEPETVPPFDGSQTAFITVSDVNFRAGPGADCDTIGDGPIGTNIPVTVLSGPVIREDDEFVWVQVQILDQTGWVVVEVLEPAP
ncbi:MAG: SH3 domain-containing protein [Chloroflexota bacterium]|nr:SH3 domain-containing protein [Chloroflexota bacterium]